MDYTVSDFYHRFEEKLLLLSGENGLNRPVKDVGILDYELDPSLKDKYIGDNFHPNMIIVTTFLYAKKNPYLIGEAVRYLIEKGCSALVIRNVFNLPIPETTIRYAESKKFPIMVLNGRGVYFEDFVYEVTRHAEQLKSIAFYENEIDALLNADFPDAEIVRHVRNIIPSIRQSYFILYAMPQNPIDDNVILEASRLYRQSSIYHVADKLIKYGERILFVFSSDILTSEYQAETFLKLVSFLEGSFQMKFRVGISAPHYYLSDFKDALYEAKYAAVYPASEQEEYVLYDQIGLYKLVLPHCRDRNFVRYSNQLLDPIRDYDAENGTMLFETLLTYVEQQADLKKCAASLGQHENTVRYRLEKIKSICDLDYRNLFDAAQFVAAISIDIGRSIFAAEEI